MVPGFLLGRRIIRLVGFPLASINGFVQIDGYFLLLNNVYKTTSYF